MEDILLDTMFDLPGQNDIQKIVISKEVIKGDAKPMLIYSDKRSKTGTGS